MKFLAALVYLAVLLMASLQSVRADGVFSSGARMRSWADAPDSVALPAGWVQSLLSLTAATAQDHLEHAACISVGRTAAEMRGTDVDAFRKGQLFEVAIPSCPPNVDIGSMHTHPTPPAFLS